MKVYCVLSLSNPFLILNMFCNVLSGFMLQVAIFGEVPNWSSIVGAVLVMICVIGMGVEDIIHKLFNSVP